MNAVQSVGIDMIEISRVEKSIQSEHFCQRVFGPEEFEELKSKNMRAESAAAAFAAKEAFGKALGTGLRGFSLNEVQVLHDELGKPFLKLSGQAEKTAREKSLSFALSITHPHEYAAAVVTAFEED